MLPYFSGTMKYPTAFIIATLLTTGVYVQVKNTVNTSLPLYPYRLVSKWWSAIPKKEIRCCLSTGICSPRDRARALLSITISA